MKNLQTIKAEKEQKVSDLINECKVFFAFSTEQFHKNKTPLSEGEKYVSMGMGGYLPKGHLQTWIDGMDAIEKWYKAEIKGNKARKANIAYELANHEAYYTCDISDTLDALGSDYTEAEVREVFNKERRKHAANL